MAIHTFRDYVEKFHPHIHAIVSDGLFAKTQTFYVMPKPVPACFKQGVDLKPLEEIFRARLFKPVLNLIQ